MLQRSTWRHLAAIPALALLGACAGDQVADPSLPAVKTASISGIPTAVRGMVVVCKEGSDASFNATFDNVAEPGFSLTNGECQTVKNYTGGFRKWFDVQELVPANTTLDSILVYDVYGPTAPGSVLTYSSSKVVGATHAGTWVGLEFGSVIVFYNTYTPPPPPPPPPGGGEGCTPGYWKQSQHFDSWVGYLPTQSFSSVFGWNGFGSMTLVDVLGQGGGGTKALGRHAVAALLNSASGSGVSYDLTTQQVINGFKAAVNGGDVEGQKNIFANFNEQGCPLN